MIIAQEGGAWNFAGLDPPRFPREISGNPYTSQAPYYGDNYGYGFPIFRIISESWTDVGNGATNWAFQAAIRRRKGAAWAAGWAPEMAPFRDLIAAKDAAVVAPFSTPISLTGIIIKVIHR